MAILVVGGDSAEAIKRRARTRGDGYVEHWSGRRTRDLTKPIPKHTEAVVVVLDRISHALARKVRIEATRRGLPVFFQKRGHRIDSMARPPLELTQLLARHKISGRQR
jgi:hypothetical protein